MDKDKQLNSNGNRRGMSPNSRKNLDEGRKGNNHGKGDISITHIQRGMLGELCPYAKDPTWTWAYAIAEAEMRDAIDNQKSRDSIKDRLEGKVTQPIAPVGENGAIATFMLVMPDGNKRTAKELAEGNSTITPAV